ncbi:DVUA0089 family protein [Nitrosovibrio sp. Nv4]|uniref:DVUA0089 family protein n=1 Tax=Nitrosovibrio sp. Nv4 TaxID=1945880 RepID=UPI000BDCF2C5|nr:DVUA0089 family protein [Nitrosovibrio sp. Nv4]SOD40438.1 PEP-CTERM protein-sorting domain-containing protein [Nitrosovibrio sp. Nv4]
MNMMNFVSVFGKLGAVFASLVILAGAYPAYASLYFEVDDAGTTAETANYISWDTATIIGAIHRNDGADVYGFDWAGGFFQADTIGSDFDTMLSLFNESGGLLLFNDDFNDNSGVWYSHSLLSMELDPGNYFLGVTHYANNYMGEMGNYLKKGIEGSYQIQKTVAMPLPPQPQIIAEVPEPATMALLAIGFIGIMLNRRRKIGLMSRAAF